MSELDDKMKEFESKIEKQQDDLEKKLEADLAALFGKVTKSPVPHAQSQTPRVQPVAGATQFVSGVPLVNAQINLTGADGLDVVDRVFSDQFQIHQFLAGANLQYETIYAETLDEFFAPFVESMSLSPEGKAASLANLKAEAEQRAREGGGIFGVNFPERGCYLNGWLFAYLRDHSPNHARRGEEMSARILETIAHEKLGHGFITENTELGKEKKRVGLARLDWANRFNFRSMDSPAATLLTQKHVLVHTVSQFTEEGWATWIEYFLRSQLSENRHPAPHDLDKVLSALDTLAHDQTVRDHAAEIHRALTVLFRTRASAAELYHAVLVLQASREFDDFFSARIGQPLPYAAGYLLIEKLATNLGWLCVPYAVLIAANLTYDLERISVSDLERLVTSDPRMNVDARLTMLSTVHLDTPGDVSELARVASAIGLAVPKNLEI